MDKYYVSGCKGQDDDIVTCDDSEAEFWTLYQRMSDGTSQGIIDLKFREDAAASMKVYVERDALQQKLDALSRECGMMSGLLNDISRYHEECTHDDQMHALIPLEYVSAINGFVERDVDGENPCPLTDALLNAVRAEGVEMLRGSIADIESGIEDTRDLYHYCTDFAAQLRAGNSEGATHD